MEEISGYIYIKVPFTTTVNSDNDDPEGYVMENFEDFIDYDELEPYDVDITDGRTITRDEYLADDYYEQMKLEGE